MVELGTLSWPPVGDEHWLGAAAAAVVDDDEFAA